MVWFSALTTSDYRKILLISEGWPKSLQFSSKIRKISSSMCFSCLMSEVPVGRWEKYTNWVSSFQIKTLFSPWRSGNVSISNQARWLTPWQRVKSQPCAVPQRTLKSLRPTTIGSNLSPNEEQPLLLFITSAEFIYICTLCVGCRDALIEIDGII